ncbi:stress response protein AzuC [Musicola paradisiaca]|uniref:stress response protein AzuC n=1 Tax=Musicola paradisiaca TaxID=69223 RepID=UPI000B20CB33
MLFRLATLAHPLVPPRNRFWRRCDYFVIWVTKRLCCDSTKRTIFYQMFYISHTVKVNTVRKLLKKIFRAYINAYKDIPPGAMH